MKNYLKYLTVAVCIFCVEDMASLAADSQVVERGGGGGRAGGFHSSSAGHYDSSAGHYSEGHPNYNRAEFDHQHPNENFNHNNYNEFNGERNHEWNAGWDAGLNAGVGIDAVPEGEYVYPAAVPVVPNGNGDMNTLYQYESNNPTAPGN